MTANPNKHVSPVLQTPETQEPIAIIGIGCRFPGNVNSPDDFWKLLCDGTDPIREVPADRWDLRAFYDADHSKPGKVHSRWGGYIENIDQFDADFFGISPREAARVDPQHRLLLEVSYEALEDAGQSPERTAGFKTGVFIGISTCDYGGIQVCVTERQRIDAYTNIGLGLCIAANRISHQFDFHGPSIAIDTACSSSLVAIHLACQAIRAGECEVALAGGVNALLRPEGNIGFSKASMLAPDGRCKSFDARANGYVRSEGAGIIVLKPLSRALADGDPVYAVVLGTLVNQDGRTPGLALPNRAAQELMLREAYQRAQVAPEQIHFIEAHGTGTVVGDPIELNAIGSVLGSNRAPGNECVVGSVKSNIGHLEAASGVAGLIKAALCIKYGAIPPNLHFEQPNPDIHFESMKLRVAQTFEPWSANGSTARLAGVNSFGFGGTNAHVILGNAPPVAETGLAAAAPAEDPAAGQAVILPISARSPQALEDFAKSYSAFLDDEGNSGPPLRDVCYSAALRRGHGDYRLTVVGNSKRELIQQLDAFAAGESRLSMASGRRVTKPSPKLAFVFSGMGPQWWGMGRQLLDEEPVFREIVTRCDALLGKLTDWSLLEELSADDEHSRINETQISQPAIFALQVGLAALWQSWGVEPEAIVGHSVGEVAAAYVSGALGLEDSVSLIFHRSRLQRRTAGQGEMLAVGLPWREAESLLNGHDHSVSIAAINSPGDVTLSGDAEVLRGIAAALDEKQVFCRFLQVEVPYHSPRMEPLKEELYESLSGLRPQPTKIPMYSTASGQPVAGPELDASYWWQNIRNPVQFAAAVGGLIEADCNLFLELSAQPVLAGAISKCLAERKREGTVVTTLRRQEPERTMLLSSLGKLYTLGYPVDWDRQFPRGGRLVRLPSYPWQRERHWHESDETLRDRVGVLVHPLLGQQLDSASPAWTVEIDKARLKYLTDHRVQDAVVYPAAAYVEMALAAARESFGPGPAVVEELSLLRAIFLPGNDSLSLQFVKAPGQPTFDIYSHPKGADQPWILHASGKLRRRQDNEVPRQLPLREIEERCTLEIPKTEFYRQLHKAGIQYGDFFQGVEKLSCGEGEALARIKVHPHLESELDEYLLHPSILDACFQVMLGALALKALKESAAGRAEGIFLPVRIGRIRYYGRCGKNLRSYARLVEYTADHFTGDIQLLDDAGNVLADIRGFECRAIERPSEKLDSYLYEYQWKLQARPGQAFVQRSADYIPPPTQMAARLQPEGTRLAEEFGLARYNVMEPQIKGLANAYLLTALRQLGWTFDLGQRISIDSLIDNLGITAQHRRLLERMLDVLAQDGVVAKDGNEWKIEQLIEDKDPNEVWSSLWAQFPALQAELMLVRQCGERLAEVLKGELDPLEAIFPQGSLTTAEHLYQDAPSYRIYNILAQKAVAMALEALPEDKTVRILEVGGGTGGMTAYVLRKLPPSRTEYVFSDVTQLLTAQAEQKFHEFPFVQYRLLDIEADPLAQGYEPHSFDMILASDVLHATRDLRDTLGHVKQLLASNGLLILLELTNTPRWVVFVFGLLKGWWRFTDVELRGADPWIPQRKWKALLEEVGFTDVASVADTDIPENALHSVILAQGPVIAQEPTPAEAPAAAAEKTRKVGTWLIFADKRGVGPALAARLKERGERPVLVYPGEMYGREEDGDSFRINPRRLEDMQQLVEAAIEGRTECRGVVHLWSLDTASPDETTLSSIDAAQIAGCFNALQLVQVLAKINWTTVPGLWLVTGGTQAMSRSATSVSVAQAPMWGLSRTITNEHPNLRSTVIDLSTEPTPEEIDSLFDELMADDKEDELALRGPSRYIHRLMRVSLAKIQEAAHQTASTEASQPYTVEITTPGILDNLTMRASDRPAPGVGEVEIQVHAAALNFKDVMIAMGLLPDEALEGGYTGRALGMECSGRISAIGEGVEGFQMGDEVVTSGPGALRSHMIMDAASVVHKPSHISFEEATTIPIAFSTAYYSLHYMARMERGERVLIHAAAGGVGLAAIQLALKAGAEVYATAGSPSKRNLLRALGVRHVFDSRSLAFADEIMELTGGRGVDIVLNSLAGEAIAKSISVLSPYGRFIEIGKRDIYENSKLELRPFRNNLSYFAVDLDKLCAQRPEFVRSLMRDVMQNFEDKELRPLSYRVFPVSEIVSAFRYMGQGKHIGKVVVSLRNSEVVVTPPAKGKAAFRADATYLITGGLGGFGMAVAQWLVDHGARHLVLMGRSAPAEQAAAAIEAMREAGAEVVIARADVTSERDVEAVLADIVRSMPPLRGVIHGAMVLDDALLHQLNEERMRKAMAPKAVGAWLLHSLTLNLPLDMFVMFSSFSSIIGTTRQGNYVAGNAFLDALAYHRRAQGLPALTINWGVVAGVGYVAQNADLGQKLEQFGFKSLPVQQMLNILGVLLQEQGIQVGVGHLNWQQLAKMHMIGSSSRFTYLVKPVLTDDVGGAGAWLIDAVMAVEPGGRQKFLEAHIREQLARVLGTSPSRVEVDKPLINLGLDSLMAVEIGTRMQAELGVSIPPVKFMEGLTTAGMAQYLIEQLAGDQSPAPAAANREEAISAEVAPAAAGNGNGAGSKQVAQPSVAAGGTPAPAGGNGRTSAAAAQAEAEHLLAAVDNLSDVEVDSLLRRIADEEAITLTDVEETPGFQAGPEEER
jgi:acyl transferase domain-containing protein/acyl carrier protein/protein-L-isoaspartate O-methyltransferase